MNKQSGGTRNFSSRPRTLSKRRVEFDKIVAQGYYRDSYFDKSGGYYVIHENHNEIIHHGEIGEGRINDNYEDECARLLAKKGYRVYLMSESAYIEGVKKTDGFAEHSIIDIKTINSAGRWRMLNDIKQAATQGAEAAIFFQNTPKMDKSYVEEQINAFRRGATFRGKLTHVWVVGMSGRIHRHKL